MSVKWMLCRIDAQNIQRKCNSANYSHFQLFNHKPSFFNWCLSCLMSTWPVICDLPCSNSCGTLRLSGEGLKNLLIRQSTLRLLHAPCHWGFQIFQRWKQQQASFLVNFAPSITFVHYAVWMHYLSRSDLPTSASHHFWRHREWRISVERWILRREVHFLLQPFL